MNELGPIRHLSESVTSWRQWIERQGVHTSDAQVLRLMALLAAMIAESEFRTFGRSVSLLDVFQRDPDDPSRLIEDDALAELLLKTHIERAQALHAQVATLQLKVSGKATEDLD